MMKDITLNLPHTTLAAKLWGDATKPLLIATHGWLDNANSFDTLAPLIQTHSILAFDWPGHGLSVHRQLGYPLHLTDYVFDLDAVIQKTKQEFGHEKIFLMGHSFGGIIALLYASIFPENIHKLILLDIVSPIYEEEHESHSRLKNSMLQHRKAMAFSKLPTVYDSIDTAAKVRSRITGLDFGHCRQLVSRNLKENSGGYSWRTDPKLKLSSSWRFSYKQVMSLIDKMFVSTLIILGSNTPATFQLTSFKSVFQELEIEHHQGGHHIHMDNPRTVSASVRCFINQ